MSKKGTFERWNDLLVCFRREYKREPTKAERKAISEVSGYWPTVKTKGRARDLQSKGATTNSARRSESISGGIAADNREHTLKAKPNKAPHLQRPATARP